MIVVNRFGDDFKAHGGKPENIEITNSEMSLGSQKGIYDNFANSQTIIDKFHVIKRSNETIDKVRKAEGKTNMLLRKIK